MWFARQSSRKVAMNVLTHSATLQVTTRFFIVNPKAAHGSAQDLVRDAIGTGKLGFLKNWALCEAFVSLPWRLSSQQLHYHSYRPNLFSAPYLRLSVDLWSSRSLFEMFSSPLIVRQVPSLYCWISNFWGKREARDKGWSFHIFTTFVLYGVPAYCS